MKNFRTLDLAVEFYKLSEKSDIKGNLRDQLLRASSSIPMNLAEGNAKYTIKDKKRFFQMAYGSLRECQTLFKLANLKDQTLNQKADHLGASLYKLLKSNVKEFS